jgi:hypothetical protein
MKITLPRIFDSSRMLATEAGKQVSELIDFCQQAFEQLIKLTRNNITFEDNIKCQVVTVTLRHNEQTVLASTSRIKGIIPTRVFGNALASYTWSYNDKSQLTFTATFATATSSAVSVTLILLQE